MTNLELAEQIFGKDLIKTSEGVFYLRCFFVGKEPGNILVRVDGTLMDGINKIDMLADATLETAAAFAYILEAAMRSMQNAFKAKLEKPEPEDMKKMIEYINSIKAKLENIES